MKTTATYLVALRAKPGERNALLNIERSARESIVPLFEISRNTPKKSVQEHFHAAVELIRQAWFSDGEFLLDISDIPTEMRGGHGEHPVEMLDRICRQMSLVPTWCYSLERSDTAYEEAVLDTLGRQRVRSVAVRLQQHDLLFFDETEAHIRRFLGRARVDPSKVSIIVDLLAIDASIGGSVDLLRKRLAQLDALLPGRLVLLASSMWESARLPASKETRIRRHEVALWELLLRDFPSLIFGDYGVVHPRFAEPPIDGPIIPAPKVRYPLENEWIVFKGHKPEKGESSQYVALARDVVRANWFRVNELGWGAENIRLAAIGNGSPGGHAAWIGFCTELHIDLTHRQLRVAIERAEHALASGPGAPSAAHALGGSVR